MGSDARANEFIPQVQQEGGNLLRLIDQLEGQVGNEVLHKLKVEAEALRGRLLARIGDDADRRMQSEDMLRMAGLLDENGNRALGIDEQREMAQNTDLDPEKLHGLYPLS